MKKGSHLLKRISKEPEVPEEGGRYQVNLIVTEPKYSKVNYNLYQSNVYHLLLLKDFANKLIR